MNSLWELTMLALTDLQLYEKKILKPTLVKAHFVHVELNINMFVGALTSLGGLRESCVSCCGSSSASLSVLGGVCWFPEATGRWYCVVPVGTCQK